MVARTTPPAELARFSRAERWVHALVGALVVAMIVTAAILYLGPLAVAVGHRNIVETVHVWCGLALPVPVLLGLGSVAFRVDLSRLNRWTPPDRAWLRDKRRRYDNVGVGKFNAGQKLNTALASSALVVLFGTGVLMYWPSLVGLRYRTGATFVHDVIALGLGLLVIGHIVKALQDREAIRALRTGLVPVGWARRHHPVWAEEMTPPAPGRGDADDDAVGTDDPGRSAHDGVGVYGDSGGAPGAR